MNFSEYVKNSTKNVIISKICSLLEKDPSKNIDKLFNLSIKLTKDTKNKSKIRDLYDYYNNNPLIKNFIENLLININPNFLKKFAINFLNYVLNSNDNTYFPFFVIDLSSKDINDKILYSELDKILKNVKENKISYVFIIGKEPFSIDPLFNIYKKYSNILFIPFTNGELFTPIICNKLSTLFNVVPIISLNGFKDLTDYSRGEGTFNKVMSNLDLLKYNSIPFGISSNISFNNIMAVTSNRFIDMILKKGAFINLYFYDSVINEKKEKLQLYRKIKHLKITPPYIPLNFLDNSITSKIIIDKNSLYNNELKLNFNNMKYCFHSIL
ncbi:radical SAM protein [Clostridium taeniosporum]|uniref:Fe-S oxidoreductase n=1 Tax=Clostridium taeniosporum TaxID=394958 RepID=A0A1D7XJ22_9CLOT|nr:Fe-S oxidoreductase [Clostridium taeniosporum]AOR23325.1 Fe-S oxidoreductase [Clostridium taeniosporum]